MDELSSLVRAANRDGASFDELAERAIDPETGERGASKAFLYKLASGKVGRAPELPALRAIAAALRLPLATVQRAAAQQYLGFDPADTDPTVVKIRSAGLPPRVEERLLERYLRRRAAVEEEIEEDIDTAREVS